MGSGKMLRAHSPEFKAWVVERMRECRNVSALAAELGLRRRLLYRWKQAVEEGRLLRGAGRPAKQVGDRPMLAQDAAGRIKELEALVGRLTLENRFFEGALQSIEELRQLKSANSSAASSRRSKC